MEIYKTLSYIMQSRDLSVADVARICGIPDSTIRGIITRKQKTVALDVAFKLSDGLNVSLQYLNGLTDIQDEKETSYQDLQEEKKDPTENGIPEDVFNLLKSLSQEDLDIVLSFAKMMRQKEIEREQ